MNNNAAFFHSPRVHWIRNALAQVPANQAVFTALANFSGGPAVALPVVLPGEYLPSSVQLVGPHWAEARLLAWAERLAPVLAEPD